MPLIPLSLLVPDGRPARAADALCRLAPGLVLASGQAASGKLTLLTSLAQRLAGTTGAVHLVTDRPREFDPFLPRPPSWTLHVIEATPDAWRRALESLPAGDLVLVTPLTRVNAPAVVAAASGRWMLATMETPLTGLDVGPGLREMGVDYASLCEVLRGLWAQDQPVFRAGVKLVLVDVTVTGDDDQPLTDLTPADFELTEDGVPQTVEQATLVRLDGAPRGDKEALEIRSQAHALAEAGRDDVRLFAVFMDDYHLGRYPQEMIPLRKALGDFLGGMMGPLDLVTVMNPITPLSALEWTRDRQRLVQGIRTYEGRNDNFIGRSPLEESQNLSRNAARVRSQVVITALQALVMHLSGLREGELVVVDGVFALKGAILKSTFAEEE
mgnify:CR=1 FL=1